MKEGSESTQTPLDTLYCLPVPVNKRLLKRGWCWYHNASVISVTTWTWCRSHNVCVTWKTFPSNQQRSPGRKNISLFGPVAQIVCFFLLFLTGHGNHKEDSPFLSSADAAGKKNDFYDRNLALFEVCCFVFLFFYFPIFLPELNS